VINGNTGVTGKGSRIAVTGATTRFARIYQDHPVTCTLEIQGAADADHAGTDNDYLRSVLCLIHCVSWYDPDYRCAIVLSSTKNYSEVSTIPIL
jgi:hypothetical protein